jgi:hypothetical protein
MADGILIRLALSDGGPFDVSHGRMAFVGPLESFVVGAYGHPDQPEDVALASGLIEVVNEKARRGARVRVTVEWLEDEEPTSPRIHSWRRVRFGGLAPPSARPPVHHGEQLALAVGT